MSKEIELAEKQSLERFNFLKATSKLHVENLSAIKVTDATSAAIAGQKLSDAKGFISDIEATRVTIKKPYLETGKNIDKAAKDLSSPVETEWDRLNKELLAYKQLENKKREEEAEKARKIREKITTYQANSIVEINNCKTLPELSQIYKGRVLSFPADEDWGDFVAEAKAMKDTIIKHGKLRKAQIEELINAPVEKKEEIVNKQEAEIAEATVQNVEASTEKIDDTIAIAENTKQTGIRKDWAFEIVDINLVPRNYLIPNEAAIREWMREMITSNKIIPGQETLMNGVKFYQKESLIVRK